MPFFKKFISENLKLVYFDILKGSIFAFISEETISVQNLIKVCHPNKIIQKKKKIKYFFSRLKKIKFEKIFFFFSEIINFSIFFREKKLLDFSNIFIIFPFFFIKKKGKKKYIKKTQLLSKKNFIEEKDLEIFLFISRTKNKGIRKFNLTSFIKNNSNISTITKRLNSRHLINYFSRNDHLKKITKWGCALIYKQKKKNDWNFYNFFRGFLQFPQFFTETRNFFLPSIIFRKNIFLPFLSKYFYSPFFLKKKKLFFYRRISDSFSIFCEFFSFSLFFFKNLIFPPCVNCPISFECSPQSLINPYDCINFLLWNFSKFLSLL
jgi:hypothetical protein